MPCVTDTGETAADGVSGQRGNKKKKKKTTHLQCSIVKGTHKALQISTVWTLCHYKVVEPMIPHSVRQYFSSVSSWFMDWLETWLLNDDNLKWVYTTNTTWESLRTVCRIYVHTKTPELKVPFYDLSSRTRIQNQIYYVCGFYPSIHFSPVRMWTVSPSYILYGYGSIIGEM